MRAGTPTNLSVSPAKRKLAVGESQTVVASSEYGPEATVSWVSSDPNVVTVDGAGKIKGMIPGEVTVTGTVGSLTATATVTVVGAPLAPGDVRWSMVGSSPASQSLGAGAPMAPAHRIDELGPDFFSVVYAPSAGVPVYLVEGFDANGMHLSTETTTVTPQGGDIYGE
jgi:hypothetical protein